MCTLTYHSILVSSKNTGSFIFYSEDSLVPYRLQGNLVFQALQWTKSFALIPQGQVNFKLKNRNICEVNLGIYQKDMSFSHFPSTIFMGGLNFQSRRCGGREYAKFCGIHSCVLCLFSNTSVSQTRSSSARTYYLVLNNLT